MSGTAEGYRDRGGREGQGIGWAAAGWKRKGKKSVRKSVVVVEWEKVEEEEEEEEEEKEKKATLHPPSSCSVLRAWLLTK
ncbi:hypothetical protein E2C01_041860 [Portunus trituberculatus]|uniref:Uncharacterized protein n=1 Tax=Portunus trituberculatus TaxID=210409 RepID=A0A5B7FRT4_PORTR|nr:hypothetical protein [Portunus trituberculatus]